MHGSNEAHWLRLRRLFWLRLSRIFSCSVLCLLGDDGARYICTHDVSLVACDMEGVCVYVCVCAVCVFVCMCVLCLVCSCVMYLVCMCGCGCGCGCCICNVRMCVIVVSSAVPVDVVCVCRRRKIACCIVCSRHGRCSAVCTYDNMEGVATVLQ